MAQDTVFYQKIIRIFDQKSSPIIMGILNVTPDSFFDGGKYIEEQYWLEHAKEMIDAGADIIDIGAYSTRPGANEVSEEDELDRLIKVIVSIRKAFPEILISADTYRSEVARRSVAAGANIINDISGGNFDDKMFKTIAQTGVAYVLMHIQGTPKNMQDDPKYDDVENDVFEFFENKLQILRRFGIENVIIDPGFGFGKTVEHNYSLLKNLNKFQSLNCPVLAGLSRKSMINKLLNISSKESLNGTSILNEIALQNGAKILRVHDVKEAKEAITIYNYLKGLK